MGERLQRERAHRAPIDPWTVGIDPTPADDDRVRVRHEVADGQAVITVRAPAILRWCLPIAYAGLVTWAAIGLLTGEPGALLALAVFGWFGTVALAGAVRGRIEVRGDDVRIVRAFSEDVLARDEIDAVARWGGRGKPAHLSLVAGASRPQRAFVLDRHPGIRTVDTRGIGLPSSMTAARAARALGVRLTNHAGGEPPPPCSVELAQWHRRPFVWACAVLSGIGLGIAVWGLFFFPGPS